MKVTPNSKGLDPKDASDNVKPGDYLLRIKSANEVTFNSGNPGFKIVFTVEESLTPEVATEDVSGAELWWNLVFHPDYPGMRDRNLRALGYDIQPQQEIEVTEANMAKRTCIGRVAIEEYNGEERPKVSSIKVDPNAEDHNPLADMPF